MDICGYCKLGDSFFRIPDSGAGQQNRLSGNERGAAKDFAGGDNLVNIRSVFNFVYEGTSSPGLSVGGPVHFGGVILYIPQKAIRGIRKLVRIYKGQLLKLVGLFICAVMLEQEPGNFGIMSK